ncbi:MAG TPA: hypothetical protein VME24_12475 [Alphaproteobacteria bacterium]|nr:hypothetical protein [Alphaproteobacteria bacterium]
MGHPAAGAATMNLPITITGLAAKYGHDGDSPPWIRNNSEKSLHWADVPSIARLGDLRQWARNSGAGLLRPAAGRFIGARADLRQ